MKNVARVVVLGLILAPLAFLGGCAKRCGKSEPVMEHKVEKMKREYGGK